MKKITIILFVLMTISACSANPKLEEAMDTLNNTVLELEHKLEKEKGKSESLSLELLHLKQSFDDYDYTDNEVSFKEVLNLKGKVLNKQSGDNIYPFYMLITLEDREHNTPLLLTVENKDTYDKYQEGDTYEFPVHVTLVVDKDTDNIRFMYMLVSDDNHLIYKSNVIPDEMVPSSVIEFISNEEFVVLKGDIVEGYDKDPFEDMPNTEPYPDPKKGMKVYYADDGFILRIEE